VEAVDREPLVGRRAGRDYLAWKGESAAAEKWKACRILVNHVTLPQKGFILLHRRNDSGRLPIPARRLPG